MTYVQPFVPLIPNAINADLALQKLQLALAEGLPWLDYSFHKATVNHMQKADSAEEWVYPEVYDGNGGYINVEPNNHYAAHSYFQVLDGEEPVSWLPYQRGSFTLPAELIVLFNLDKVKAKQGYPYAHRFTEELKSQILHVLRDNGAQLRRIYETPAEVFRGYSYNQLERQTFRHPEGGFKFVFDVHYDEVCTLVVP